LAGLGGEDGIWGLVGDAGLSGGAGGMISTGVRVATSSMAAQGTIFWRPRTGPGLQNCGPGRDAASVDLEDLVSRSCEAIYPA
jgi:hypothetical protein